MAVPFLEKISTLLNLLVEPKVLSALLSQRHSGYLADSGWFVSFRKHRPLDAKGNPIPWVTYPFVDFVKSRLHVGLSVFEFGSGNSTLFYAARCGSVTSVEHDEGWYALMKKQLPNNSELLYEELIPGGRYCRKALELKRQFDVIIVDGEDRVNCIFKSPDSLSRGGVLVLDDSERDEYLPAIDFMLGHGYKRLDFWGIAPMILFKKCTTIFYKDQNCLGI